MRTPAVISLGEKSGNFARTVEAAGLACVCVDTGHSIRRERHTGMVSYVWGDFRRWTPPADIEPVFLAMWPPCTHVAGSGARDFETKGGLLLRDALETFEACQLIAGWAGVPWFIENPVGILTRLPHIGKPDHYFDPCDYAGWLPESEQPDEAYTKKTCLWAGGGFVMPNPKPVLPLLGSKIFKLPPSADRADLRSATPRGFAKAVVAANLGPLTEKIAA